MFLEFKLQCRSEKFVLSDFYNTLYVLKFMNTFLEYKSKKNEIVAVVNWYWRQTEIPSYILKKIKFHVYEVFKDYANTPGEIDPETILGKCQVCINAEISLGRAIVALKFDMAH